MPSQEHPAVNFVHGFHADLTHWFTGDGERALVRERLASALHPEMVLVYPSGNRLGGAEFLESIDALYGTSQGFVASISNTELLVGDVEHAVVAYVETQTGARNSQSVNSRSALALVVRRDDRWVWRFIQETATPG
ncbi:MAG: DUF4440 domain-containing protein [Myxococcota bacterium]